MPKVLLEGWEAIIQHVQAEGINLEDSIDVEDLKTKVDVHGIPVEMIIALLCYLCQTNDLEAVSPKLDRVTTVKWTGEITAMSDTLGQDIKTGDLLSHWQNRLPEAWRYDATIEAAEELKSSQENGKVNSVNPGPDEAATGTKRQMKGRDWHARLKRVDVKK